MTFRALSRTLPLLLSAPIFALAGGGVGWRRGRVCFFASAGVLPVRACGRGQGHAPLNAPLLGHGARGDLVRHEVADRSGREVCATPLPRQPARARTRGEEERELRSLYFARGTRVCSRQREGDRGRGLWRSFPTLCAGPRLRDHRQSVAVNAQINVWADGQRASGRSRWERAAGSWRWAASGRGWAWPWRSAGRAPRSAGRAPPFEAGRPPPFEGRPPPPLLRPPLDCAGRGAERPRAVRSVALGTPSGDG